MGNKANDYRQMAELINYLSQHYAEQPSLEKMASVVDLSPQHFQRKFKAWAGVTPKSFIQFLTFKNAKQMLEKGKSVMDVAHDSGLSSPSRLHDLCLKIKAASPGEIKCGGQGLAIDYGFGFSPFGECLIASSPRGIVKFVFVDANNRDQAANELWLEWPQAIIRQNDQSAINLIEKIFNYENNQSSPLGAYVKGTQFQLRVWSALLKTAPGELISYGQLAQHIGFPKASRAVGTAVGNNPLAYLIPCHRVIRGTGVFGHYRWGSGRKRIMIAYEAIQN
jgi:AraC family transcriptional regulator, regulatory protein of adaptative response / methylated-DNA-[protein]-cysteine methyltransferase